MLLNITATSACTAGCVYCPQPQFQAAMAGRPAYLSRQEFAALLPRLAGTQFDGFSFGGFSEPFENPDIVALLRLAAAQPFVGSVSLYTNGEALTPDTVEELQDVRLARVDVSCHGFDAETYRRTRRGLDPAKVRDNVMHLLRHRRNIAELVISVTGPFGRESALEALAALCRQSGARLERRPLHSRAGLLRVGRRAPAPPGPFRCAKFDFRKPVLVPGGDLSLCCQDFSLDLVIGNLHRQTFDEIMTGSPLRRHILEVAAGHRADPDLRCYQCAFCVPAAAGQDTA